MKKVKSMHVGRFDHALVLVKGKPIAIGGQVTRSPIEEYDI